MLITVCVESPNVKEQLNKDQDIKIHAHVKEVSASNGKSNDICKKDAKEEDDSHDSTDDQEKESKVKSQKKKKKKEKKKKKNKKKKKRDLS